jgi:Putative DNA-binding domain
MRAARAARSDARGKQRAAGPPALANEGARPLGGTSRSDARGEHSASATAQAPGRLRAFQDAFAAALVAPGPMPGGVIESPPEIASLVAQPGFAVYRNTVLKGCIDALQSNYPAVCRLVGDEWFRAAAAVYARANLPRHPSLLDYGSDFAAFLAAFEPASELPYLAGVARLERFWTDAHIARDEAPVSADAVAGFGASQLSRVTLHPHPAARWAWFDDAPIATIWQTNRGAAAMPGGDGPAPSGLEWRAEGVLITRPGGAVQWTPLGEAGCAFLDTCAGSGTLASAATAALDADPRVDLRDVMARTLGAGAFGRLDMRDDNPEKLSR